MSVLSASRRSTSEPAGRRRSSSRRSRLRVHEGDQAAREIADGDLAPAAHVDVAAHGGVAAGESDEAGARVGHEGQVARGALGAELDLVPAGGELADDRGDDRPGRLARAVGVEGPDDGDRRREAAVERLGQGVGGDLGRRVGRLALAGMALVDGYVARRAEHLGGRGDEEALDAEVAGGLQHVERALHVGGDVAVGRLVGVGDGDQRGEVEDHVVARTAVRTP